MPTRFIKESCRSSKNLDKLSDFEERLFWRLITTADDFGRFMACPELVRASCFPFRAFSTKSIVMALQSLQTHHLITLYRVEDREYGVFNTWELHQGKPRAKASKFPAPIDTQQNHMLASAIHLHANVPGHSDTDTDTDTNTNPSSLILEDWKESGIESFQTFWDAYPRKVGKKAAQKAFQNARDRPRINDLLAAISRQRASPQWAKEGGQYIPHPATWLNRGQWADVPTETKPTVFEEFLARGERDDEPTGVFERLAPPDGATVGEDVSE